MAKQNQNKNEVQNAKNGGGRGFLYATAGFLVAIIIISLAIIFIAVPMLNKRLNKMGIESIDEFVGFYRELNKYVSEDDMVENKFSSTDYKSAYDKFNSVGLNVFKNNLQTSDLDVNVFETFDYSEFELNEEVNLTDRELAALLENALKNDKLVETLGIELINKYKLNLEIKEISISKNTQKGLLECYNFVMVGKVSLGEVVKSLPWPFNGILPDSVYVLIESVIQYTADGYSFVQHGININNMSRTSHQTIVNVINSQIKDKDIEPFSLEGFSQDLSRIVYNRIESFAENLHCSITIFEDYENIDEKGNIPVMFKLKYMEKTA